MRYNRDNKLTLAEVIAYGSWSAVATEVYGPHRERGKMYGSMTVFCFGDGWKAFSGLLSKLEDRDRALVAATKGSCSLDEACKDLLARDGIFDDAYDQYQAETAWAGYTKPNERIEKARAAGDELRTKEAAEREARATRVAVARAEREARKGTKS